MDVCVCRRFEGVCDCACFVLKAGRAVRVMDISRNVELRVPPSTSTFTVQVGIVAPHVHRCKTSQASQALLHRSERVASFFRDRFEVRNGDWELLNEHKFSSGSEVADSLLGQGHTGTSDMQIRVALVC